jgi:hypothetical protein
MEYQSTIPKVVIRELCIKSNTSILGTVAGAWDSVVTCFFIDTAHNVVEYLEVIARALKPGGVCYRNV